MSEEGVERRLTTILAADVVGYSRLMAADKAVTPAQLKAHRKALAEPKAIGAQANEIDAISGNRTGYGKA